MILNGWGSLKSGKLTSERLGPLTTCGMPPELLNRFARGGALATDEKRTPGCHGVAQVCATPWQPGGRVRAADLLQLRPLLGDELQERLLRVGELLEALLHQDALELVHVHLLLDLADDGVGRHLIDLACEHPPALLHLGVGL